jgi:hypothetical protein
MLINSIKALIFVAREESPSTTSPKEEKNEKKN